MDPFVRFHDMFPAGAFEESAFFSARGKMVRKTISPT
jgi:hypothetical protein